MIGRGHKKLTNVPSKGIYKLIINKTAVIVAKNAPSTIDLVGALSSNKKPLLWYSKKFKDKSIN